MQLKSFRNWPWVEAALVVTCISLLILCFEPELSRWWHSPSPGATGVGYLDRENSDSCISEAYLAHLPASYHQQTDWPLVIFLHGGGECGDDLSAFQKNTMRLANIRGPEIPAIMLMPQCRSKCRWRPQDVHDFVIAAQRKFSIDPQRIYLVGNSMGGYGVWRAAAAYPNFFAAIVPICGGGDCENAAKLVSTPTWAFHGKKDKVVPVTKSVSLVEAIRAEGGSAKLTLYPRAGHNILDRVSETPELWSWLFEQSLNNR